ncbi:MAG: sulfide/dihydroorotate dehydrogenase-like FAD/NAD-binding protein [Acidimicrobiia bacterium]|nr:sulfide/dihydroorotate dehydrogenase-like FAD/NAD-binding protein [Acidimicrobiia bacterium]
MSFAILATEPLAPQVTRFRVSAPRVARSHRAGQFVIVRVEANGERIPLTVSDADADAGWIELIVQAVGHTTSVMAGLGAGDELPDVVGPLGRPTDVEAYGTVAVVGGGVGTAIAYPAAVALAAEGNDVVAIIGARTKELVILEDEMRQVAGQVIVTTDDGTKGRHGFVTDALADLITERTIDRVIAVGPIPMMRGVAEVTRPQAIPTVVSLNPIMVDGTGMCGGCRVLVGGETRFACVDGPEFDGHQVDFDILDLRNRAYLEFEACHRQEPSDAHA